MGKIDIRDIRVGNWLSVHHPTMPAENIQISADWIRTIERINNGFIKEDSPLFRIVEPIPLTGEILEKNGLSEGGVNICPQYFIEDGQIYIGVTLKETPDRNGGVLLFNGKRSLEYDGKIEYIHQLQNLLRDLSIEKEITI